MGYLVLERFLFRAPLRPLRTVTRSDAGLLGDRLGEAALALASPELAQAVASSKVRTSGLESEPRSNARAALALDRYRRRAGFRPTPHGLWAGVGLGTLGTRTKIATGAPEPRFRIGWARLAEISRTALDDADVRSHVRLRRAPSVVAGLDTVLWLGTESAIEHRPATLVEKRADRDDVMTAVLAATATWTPWPTVRATLAPAEDDADSAELDELDDLLLTMVDEGLLQVDLVPPLVGPLPEEWLAERLRGIPAATALAAELEEARNAGRRGEWRRVQRAFEPVSQTGAESAASAIESTLLFPSADFSLSRAAVARAAALPPLLFALQEALTPPAAEGAPDGVLEEALDATTEIFGAGALDAAALVLGDYGVPASSDGDARLFGAGGPTPPVALITLLVDRVVTAAREGAPTVDFRAEELTRVVPEVSLPATCELFLTPCRPIPGAAPGTGWLVGLHAPAGASWGRFAHALGAEAAAALLDPLRLAEQSARPGEARLDVLFSPTPEVADVCAHPPLRDATLALTGWPAAGVTALTLADLELCADPAAFEPLAWRTIDGKPVAPSALHRVRSALAPGGIWRLLVGWSLYRQHAPWALILGPLSALEWTPRMTVDGFVVAPASWRLPPAYAAGHATARDLAGWRRQARPPRFVQVGAEDELLPVDLNAATALADLVGHERVFEIWPPLGDTPDADGRRIEAVIALVDQPDADRRSRIVAATAGTASAGPVPPPRTSSHASDARHWRTFKLFGLADHQDPLLVDAVAPAIREARAAGEITGWFFLRYTDGPGQRPHLRVRVRADARAESRFARRLERWLAPAHAAGAVVALERAPYFPEAGRFGGPEAMPAVHKLFEADSDWACALLGNEAAADAPADSEAAFHAGLFDLEEGRLICLVAAFDALAAGFGLDAASRLALAQRRLHVHAADADEESAHATGRAFRKATTFLRQLLGGAAPAAVAGPLRAYQQAIESAVPSLAREGRTRVLAPLLHLSAVRLGGLNRAVEIRAYSYWARTLTSLARHPLGKH